MGQSQVPTVTKQEVKQAIQNQDSILLDVRGPSEVTGPTGLLPTAVNVPLGDLSNALNLGEQQFKETYKFDKPGLDQKIIVYCKSGMRAGSAASTLAQSGYTNVLLYSGSAMDWYN